MERRPFEPELRSVTRLKSVSIIFLVPIHILRALCKQGSLSVDEAKAITLRNPVVSFAWACGSRIDMKIGETLDRQGPHSDSHTGVQ
jgi:hypothetical protein